MHKTLLLCSDVFLIMFSNFHTGAAVLNILDWLNMLWFAATFTWDYEVIILQSGVLSRVLKLRNGTFLNQDKKKCCTYTPQHNPLWWSHPSAWGGHRTKWTNDLRDHCCLHPPQLQLLWNWCSLCSLILILFNFLLMRLTSPKPNKLCWFVWGYKPDVIYITVPSDSIPRKDFDSCSICFFFLFFSQPSCPAPCSICLEAHFTFHFSFTFQFLFRRVLRRILLGFC